MPLINNIPERYETGFIELAAMLPTQFDVFKEKIITANSTYSLEKLGVQLQDIKELEKVDIDEILLSIGSIIPYIEKKEMIDELVSDISGLSYDIDEFPLENENEFKERLIFLLNDKHIYFASKATDLINNYSNVFVLSRIITDIRPVFSLDIEATPVSALIMHTLNIHYQSNEEPYHKNISLTLNKDDLISLKEAISRAENKQDSLQFVFDAASIENLTK